MICYEMYISIVSFGKNFACELVIFRLCKSANSTKRKIDVNTDYALLIYRDKSHERKVRVGSS